MSESTEPNRKPVILDFKQVDKFTEGYDFNDSVDSIAEERGLIVVHRQPNELMFDLDSAEELAEFEKRFHRLFRDGVCGRYAMTHQESSTTGHFHAYARFRDRTFTDVEAIAIQSVCASDPMREYLNMERSLRGVENATRLFEPEYRPAIMETFWNDTWKAQDEPSDILF